MNWFNWKNKTYKEEKLKEGKNKYNINFTRRNSDVKTFDEMSCSKATVIFGTWTQNHNKQQKKTELYKHQHSETKVLTPSDSMRLNSLKDIQK